MVFRFVRSLLNNEKVIKELSESTVIKAAARLIVRGAATAEEKARHLRIGDKIGRFSDIYKEEYKKAIGKK